VDDALGKALEDGAPRVRGAAIVALALRRAGAWREAIGERLADEHEDVEVRAAAARALGGLCDTKAADKLSTLARALASPVATEDEQTLGTAALEGLAFLHPADLPSRLAPLRDKNAPPHVRAAAEKALAAHGSCR
jgi:HEAT repeat protein